MQALPVGWAKERTQSRWHTCILQRGLRGLSIKWGSKKRYLLLRSSGYIPDAGKQVVAGLPVALCGQECSTLQRLQSSELPNKYSPEHRIYLLMPMLYYLISAL